MMKSYLVLLFVLHLISSSSQARKNLPSGTEVHSSVTDDCNGKNKMLSSSKIGHIVSRFGRGGSGGGGGSSENGNNGGSTPNGGGGAAVIPIYGAGGSNMHRKNHHGSAGRNSICIRISLSASALALAVTQLYI